MKIRKILPLLLAGVITLTACNAGSDISSEIPEETSVTTTQSTTEATTPTPETEATTTTPETEATTTTPETEATTTTPETEATTTTPETEATTPAPETEATTPAPETEITTTTVATTPAPKWTETEISGTKYVNTSCYSRKEAMLGAEKVKLYNVNDKVEVIAKTDTGYFKLKDGDFIHGDYLSDKEIVVQSTTTTTTTTITTTDKPVESVPESNDNGTVVCYGYSDGNEGEWLYYMSWEETPIPEKKIYTDKGIYALNVPISRSNRWNELEIYYACTELIAVAEVSKTNLINQDDSTYYGSDNIQYYKLKNGKYVEKEYVLEQKREKSIFEYPWDLEAIRDYASDIVEERSGMKRMDYWDFPRFGAEGEDAIKQEMIHREELDGGLVDTGTIWVYNGDPVTPYEGTSWEGWKTFGVLDYKDDIKKRITSMAEFYGDPNEPLNIGSYAVYSGKPFCFYLDVDFGIDEPNYHHTMRLFFLAI